MGKFILLNQTEAAHAIGCSINSFHSRKKHFKTNGESGHKKKYFIPYEMTHDDCKEMYKDEVIQSDDPTDILRQLSLSADVGGQIAQMDIMQARRQKILKQTEYLSQKITAKKQELFNQWSEKFFIVFEKSFKKFKNSLINLHLSDSQVSILNQNLDYAISNLQKSLEDIKSNYIAEQENEGEV